MAYTEPPIVTTGDLFDATDWEVYIRDNAIFFEAGLADYAQIENQQTSGTDGGTFTSGSWQTRVLNTEVADVSGLVTLASNQITAQAGQYRCWAWAAAGPVGHHQLRLYNIDDSSVVLLGLSCQSTAAAASGNLAIVVGGFTLATAKVLELQHRCQTTASTNGLGVATGWGTEIYASIMLWRIGD